MPKEIKEHDILDDVRKAEKAIKMQLLVKQLAVLKGLAREILEAKAKSEMILQDIGVSEADIKRVIDFVNSSPEVQLTEEDKKELRDEIRSDGQEARKEVQKKIESNPSFYASLTGATSNSVNYMSAGIGGTSYTGSNYTNATNTTNAANYTVSSDTAEMLKKLSM